MEQNSQKDTILKLQILRLTNQYIWQQKINNDFCACFENKPKTHQKMSQLAKNVSLKKQWGSSKTVCREVQVYFIGIFCSAWTIWPIVGT